MNRTALSFAGTNLAACALLAVLAGRLPAPERQAGPNPVSNGPQPSAEANGPDFITKGYIESPTKTVIAGQSAPAVAGTANPQVEPGKVRWHASLAAASTAAQKSGKPILLFQMMGKLDEQFC
jgi:hypothetical protein